MSSSDNIKLTDEQTRLLYEAQQKDSPEIVESDTLDTVREVLGGPLEAKGIRDPSDMSLEALAAQFTDDDGDVSVLAQNPLTGGDPETTVEAGVPLDDSGKVDIDAMSAGKVREVYDDVKKIKMLESRIPEHTEKLKRELATDLGCEPDEIPSKKEFDEVL